MHFTFSYVSAFGLVDRLTHRLQAHDLLAGFVLAALPSQHPSPDRGLPLSLERRRSPRIPFLASAEIIDETENTRSTSQLSDLSLHACFVQLPNPFPEGTPVTIEFTRTRSSKPPPPWRTSCPSAAWVSPSQTQSRNLPRPEKMAHKIQIRRPGVKGIHLSKTARLF